jgi:hypothetical protein
MDRIQEILFFSLAILNGVCLHSDLELKWKLALFVTSLVLLLLVFLTSSLLTDVDTLIERKKMFEGGEWNIC